MRRFIAVTIFLAIYIVNLVFLYLLTPVLFVLKILNKIFVFVWYIAKYQFVNLLQYAPQSVRDVIKLYDAKGLKYNELYLASIRNKVARLPLEKQAEYVTEGVKKTVDNYHWCNCSEPMIPLINETDLFSISTCEIGNMAYIAMFVPATAENKWIANDCYNTLAKLRNDADLYAKH